jgi:hypothetical protein
MTVKWILLLHLKKEIFTVKSQPVESAWDIPYLIGQVFLKLVGFCDLLGTPYAPVSKIGKCPYFIIRFYYRAMK